MYGLVDKFIYSIVRGWKSENPFIRTIIITIIIIASLGIGAIFLTQAGYLAKDDGRSAYLALGIAVGVLGAVVMAFDDYLASQKLQAKIDDVEKQVRAHPEKPQLAWDLARTKLESYLDRNLSQVRSIYWLTLVVMISGFCLVAFGIFHAMEDPEKLPISIVASASGVMISFIGGSFLLIYRSILSQSRGYVTVLERINAVGMAVQVIASIPDTDGSLKSQTTAELAKQLLSLYAVDNSPRRDSSNRND